MIIIQLIGIVLVLAGAIMDIVTGDRITSILWVVYGLALFEIGKYEMKPEQEVRKEIKEITKAYWHVLDCYPATTEVNAPRALMQVSAKAKLDCLYDVLEERRPRFKCDDSKKINH